MNSLQGNRMEVVMQGWAVPLPRCGAGAAVPRRLGGGSQAKQRPRGEAVWFGRKSHVVEFLHLTNISRTPTLCLVQGQKGLCRPC